MPLFTIASNCGLDGAAIVAKMTAAGRAAGSTRVQARSSTWPRGIIDPVKVSYSAVRNAASVAGLIRTTRTLIVKKPDLTAPTAGPALGAGAERLSRS
jgi:chaperonin GroEL